MHILLDTHILIWHLEGSDQLTSSQLAIINDPDNTIFVSIGSLWEIAIKLSIRKLLLSHSLSEIIEKIAILDLHFLSIQPEHLIEVSDLPIHHRDPFDRLLIAQAIRENLSMLTRDKTLSRYGVTIL